MRIIIVILLCLLTMSCSQQKTTTYGKDSLSNTSTSTILSRLKQQLNNWKGTPYRYGGMTKKGIDCSGLVYLTYKKHFSVSLPRITREQVKVGKYVARSQLKPGDLVFFKTGRGINGMHVGIYYTGQQFLHASNSYGVTLSSLNNPYWKKVYWQARRV